eukprot:CAMPEP_0117017770 /NCGR_PEP_ID=MMETSP0472-20121206/13829_1 /TAXON_ID=693140 ORGANISM="Tiarina fusus, Strain LIS" /NCGR_SAMPLE_ID=MMETSP0472 /ASSEMBLY_ACC=CAM_ASM_000603 /LENGTH=88 /DNA_ID=CAMNT_0004722229 /DNA_START=407 /DNA_END=670 /DNA_ORIENTATION=-
MDMSQPVELALNVRSVSNKIEDAPKVMERKVEKETTAEKARKVDFDKFPIFKGKKILLDVKNLDNPKQMRRYLIAYGAAKVSAEWHIF